MTGNLPPMNVRHVRRSIDVPAPRLVSHRHHLIHVAFDNRLKASEKRIDGRFVSGHAARTVGRSFILPAGCEMWGWTTGDVDFLRLEIHADVLEAASGDLGGGKPANLAPQLQLDDPVLWHLACVLRADMAVGQPGGQLFRDGVQELIARHLATVHLGISRHSRAPGGSLTIGQFRRVREYIRKNLNRELRLAEMAQVVGLSTFHFARAFKATAGVAPYRYLVGERLETARRLLEATDMQIGEVARSTGFQSLTGFGAAFRQRWGVSPSLFRRSAQD